MQEKWNALHTLAASGQINVVDQLLKRGAHIDALDMVFVQTIDFSEQFGTWSVNYFCHLITDSYSCVV
jgi:hypothetical protein